MTADDLGEQLYDAEIGDAAYRDVQGLPGRDYLVDPYRLDDPAYEQQRLIADMNGGTMTDPLDTAEVQQALNQFDAVQTGPGTWTGHLADGREIIIRRDTADAIEAIF